MKLFTLGSRGVLLKVDLESFKSLACLQDCCLIFKSCSEFHFWNKMRSFCTHFRNGKHLSSQIIGEQFGAQCGFFLAFQFARNFQGQFNNIFTVSSHEIVEVYRSDPFWPLTSQTLAEFGPGEKVIWRWNGEELRNPWLGRTNLLRVASEEMQFLAV